MISRKNLIYGEVASKVGTWKVMHNRFDAMFKKESGYFYREEYIRVSRLNSILMLARKKKGERKTKKQNFLAKTKSWKLNIAIRKYEKRGNKK